MLWCDTLQLVIILCYLVNTASSLPTITSTSAAASYTQVVDYLRTLGYLPKASENSHVDYGSQLPSAITDFQRMARLPVSGVLDERTVEMMNKPRCGVRDSTDPLQLRKKRFVSSEGKWKKNILSWKVTQFSSQLSRVQIIQALKTAFRHWSAVTNLHFEYKLLGDVDIEVKFSKGRHHDGYKFDGQGGVLAHAFFPPDSVSTEQEESLAGDLHFDEDEKWTVHINSTGQNLVTVALHEIGHCLGLEHSNEEGSVMWPWTTHTSLSGHLPKLSQDDVTAVQSLYGSKRYRRDQHDNVLCQQQTVDALVNAVDNNIYLFSGKTVQMLNRTTLEVAGAPRPVDHVFPGTRIISEKIDGAVTPHLSNWDAKTYLFSGNYLFRYDVNATGAFVLDDGYPASVSDRWKMPIDNYDSIFTILYRNRIVFIKGTRYWLHTGTTYGPWGGYPRPTIGHSIFQNITGTLKAAFLHTNRTNYFVDEEGVLILHPVAGALPQRLCTFS